jgi:hypothetical protein
MEFQEFAKQYLRMHNAYFKKDCKGCPLKSVCSEFSNCTYVSIKYPREAESIVAKWAAEHPEKPRVWTMDDFKAGKIAVIPGTAENLRRFLDECARAGLRWFNNNADAMPGRLHAIAFDFSSDDHLGWDDPSFYASYGWTVIPFSALTLPELVYPTWKQYWKENFPSGATPCPQIFMECECNGECDECNNRPIPADIAEKLGVKPIYAEPPRQPEKSQEPKYREVRRRAKVGDKVKIVFVSPQSNGDYKVGDELAIVERRMTKGGAEFPHYKDDYGAYLYESEYVVLEPITEA